MCPSVVIRPRGCIVYTHLNSIFHKNRHTISFHNICTSNSVPHQTTSYIKLQIHRVVVNNSDLLAINVLLYKTTYNVNSVHNSDRILELGISTKIKSII